MAERTDKVQLPKEYKAEDFVKEYDAICKKTGFQLVVNPTYIARDDGTFSTKLQFSVGLLPKVDK